MKLLIVSDSLFPLTIFSSRDDKYWFGEIHVDFVSISDISQMNKLKDILTERRYHLVLTLIQADFSEQYIPKSDIANVVNSYHSADLALNIVNKTTSYFNIFLPIAKSVSVDQLELELPRKDVVNSLNYPIANELQSQRANYYILNYSADYPIEFLKELLTKLE